MRRDNNDDDKIFAFSKFSSFNYGIRCLRTQWCDPYHKSGKKGDFVIEFGKKIPPPREIRRAQISQGIIFGYFKEPFQKYIFRRRKNHMHRNNMLRWVHTIHMENHFKWIEIWNLSAFQQFNNHHFALSATLMMVDMIASLSALLSSNCRWSCEKCSSFCRNLHLPHQQFFFSLIITIQCKFPYQISMEFSNKYAKYTPEMCGESNTKK